MKKSKKVLWISLITIDVLLTLFLFVVSIIMIVTMPSAETMLAWKAQGHVPQNFIEYFQMNTTVYLFVGVIPLFLLLGANIVGLVIFVKKTSAKKKLALNDLNEEQKEALRQELLKDLSKGSTPESEKKSE